MREKEQVVERHGAVEERQEAAQLPHHVEQRQEPPRAHEELLLAEPQAHEEPREPHLHGLELLRAHPLQP